jgi:Protein of unknown function (DUF4089)
MNEHEIAACVDAASAANGIALDAEERARVILHFTRMAILAAPLLELALTPDVEMAPVFRP